MYASKSHARSGCFVQISPAYTVNASIHAAMDCTLGRLFFNSLDSVPRIAADKDWGNSSAMSMYSPFQALCAIFIGTGGELGLIITPEVEGMVKEAEFDADDVDGTIGIAGSDAVDRIVVAPTVAAGENWWTQVSEAAGGIEPIPTVRV